MPRAIMLLVLGVALSGAALSHQLTPAKMKVISRDGISYFHFTNYNLYENRSNFSVMAYRDPELEEQVFSPQFSATPQNFTLTKNQSRRFIVRLQDYEGDVIYVCTKALPVDAEGVISDTGVSSRICSKVSVYRKSYFE